MKSSLARIAAVICTLALVACGSEPTMDEKFEAQRQQIIAEGARNAIAGYERKEQLFNQPLLTDPPAGVAACKASIGELMSQAPSIMSSKLLGKGRYEVTYLRPSDGERWSFRCRVTQKELMWASLENGRQGPWRGAEEIRYGVSNGRLILTLHDLNGDDYEAVFSYPKLKKLS